MPVTWNSTLGAIGVDTNPDGLATVEVDREGNFIKHEYLSAERLWN